MSRRLDGGEQAAEAPAWPVPERESADPIAELRATAASVAPEPAAAAYLEKVRTGAYAVTDGDVAALKAAGLSEDEIFEQTVAVAVGEGLRRLDKARAVIGGSYEV